MIENQNISNDITVEEKDGGGNTVYELSPEDLRATVTMQTTTELELRAGELIQADTCVRCAERAEHWFKLIPLQTADYSFTANTHARVGARLYNEDGKVLAFDNMGGESNIFLINYTLQYGEVYYLRITPKYNYFTRFSTIITGTFTPVESVSISDDAVSLIPNETVTLSATVLPENATIKTLIWSSSDDNIVEVDDFSGVVTAVSPGTATISVRSVDTGMKKAFCTVTVVNLKENVEYHLLCNGENEKALRVCTGKKFQLASVPKVQGERKSYWKRQKWVLKSDGANKKLFTQLNNNYYLCNNGSNEGYVSKSASDENSNIVIISCANSSDLYEIKLANSDLYLTLEYNSFDECYWAKWCSKSASNNSNQIWQFVEQPANLHNGVDTGSILNETTIQALKDEGTEFAIRYYKILDTLKDVPLKTLATTPGDYTVIDDTIQQLQEKEINLDGENYLEYADTILLDDNNLFITGSGKSLITDEKELYKKYGINIVSVYQNEGTKYEYFTEKHAKIDALSALLSAKILGQPQGTAIYFAVDFDIEGDRDKDDEENRKIDRIKTYFDIIKHKIGGRYKIGVYGSGYVCSAIKPNYAEYSWLKHSIDHEDYYEYDDPTKYNIKQAEIYYCNGIEVDDDVAVGNDYGQWEV